MTDAKRPRVEDETLTRDARFAALEEAVRLNLELNKTARNKSARAELLPKLKESVKLAGPLVLFLVTTQDDFPAKHLALEEDVSKEHWTLIEDSTCCAKDLVPLVDPEGVLSGKAKPAGYIKCVEMGHCHVSYIPTISQAYLGDTDY